MSKYNVCIPLDITLATPNVQFRVNVIMVWRVRVCARHRWAPAARLVRLECVMLRTAHTPIMTTHTTISAQLSEIFVH